MFPWRSKTSCVNNSSNNSGVATSLSPASDTDARLNKTSNILTTNDHTSNTDSASSKILSPLPSSYKITNKTTNRTPDIIPTTTTNSSKPIPQLSLQKFSSITKDINSIKGNASHTSNSFQGKTIISEPATSGNNGTDNAVAPCMVSSTPSSVCPPSPCSSMSSTSSLTLLRGTQHHTPTPPTPTTTTNSSSWWFFGSNKGATKKKTDKVRM